MSKQESHYLDQLEFDEKLNKSVFAFFLDRTRLIILIVLMIFAAGIMAVKSLPLESNPEVNIGVITVVTTLPGASPQVMEELVTKKLEQQIAKVKGIDTVTSTSQNSVSAITVQLLSTTNNDQALSDIHNQVDLVIPNLPKDTNGQVINPTVKAISFDDSPIWAFSISGPYNGFQLYNYAKKIKDTLEANTLVSEADISGGDQTEFAVFIDPKKLDAYHLSLSQVNSALANANFNMPIGTFDVENYTHVVSVDARYYTSQDIKDLVVAKLGDTGIIHMRDIANISDYPIKRTTYSRLSSKGSEPIDAVTIRVVKKPGWSIVNLIDEGQKTLSDMQNTAILPKDLKIVTILDMSERIRLDLWHLINDGLLTIVLVFGVLFLVIGIKEAAVAGTSAPLVFLVTFVVMGAAGQTLNFLSMFALILALGLLVDDAIVVISAINQYKASGKFTTREAALLVLRDFKMVLTSTTLTVVWIFSAMLFMTGIIGKYIFSIPFIMTVTLLSSLVIALTINPSLAIIFAGANHKTDISPNRKKHWTDFLDKWLISLHPLQKLYERAVTKILDSRITAFMFFGFVIILFVSAIGLVATGIVKTDFFPKSDSDTISINIEAEPGMKLETVSQMVKPVEQRLLQEHWIDSFATTIGSSATPQNGSATQGSNYAYISINLIKKEYGRTETSMDIAEWLRKDFDKIKTMKVTVAEQWSGPPAGSDFQVGISGDDFTIMNQISKKVQDVLATIPGAINISSSRKPLPSEFRFSFDNDKLALYNLTLPQVSVFLYNVVHGAQATKIYKGTDEIDVMTYYDTGYTQSLDSLMDTKIPNNSGHDVYLRDIAKNTLVSSVFGIDHKDQKRIITISADAANTTTGPAILAAFNAKIANYKLPSGYAFVFGWANDENQKSIASLGVALLGGLLFIVATLIILFDSYKQAVLVLITIPLSLIGVFFGLALFNQPLSFPGMIGLVALFGIVVRNGIILFDKINLNLKNNIPFRESIIDAGKTRLEPVLLTSICTVIGMIPLGVSNPLWLPLALSIIFGLSASTFFTLLMLPTLYFLFLGKNAKRIIEKVHKATIQ